MRLSMFVWVNFTIAIICVIFALINLYWLVVGDPAAEPYMLALWIIASVANFMSWRSER